MNVKILFFPLSITIALFVSIFYVKPDIEIALANRAVLVQKQALSEEINQKIRNAKDLEESLDANKANEDAVLHYLPDSRDDDRIVDSVNFLATQSGLLLDSVKINKASAEQETAPVEEISAGSSVILASGANSSASAQSAAVPPVIPKVLGVTVSAKGSYEGIRDTVVKLSHMDRFQDFSSVEIAKGNSGDGENSDSALDATLVMNFSYLSKTKSRDNLNLPILNQRKFDFGTVQKLQQYISSPVPSIESGATGKANPFLR